MIAGLIVELSRQLNCWLWKFSQLLSCMYTWGKVWMSLNLIDCIRKALFVELFVASPVELPA